MTWLYLPPACQSAPASAGSTSGCAEPWQGYAPSATSSGMLSPRPCSWPGWKRRPWIALLSGMTLPPLTAARGVESWISWLVEHRVKTSPEPDGKLGLTGPEAGSSSNSAESSPRLGRGGCSGRTSLPGRQGELFPASSMRSTGSGTPRREGQTGGPTWSLARTMLEPRTEGSGCSSWPTPRASDGPKGGPNQRGRRGDPALPGAAVAWATPSARDWRDGRASAETCARNSRPLNEQAVSQWPTPAAARVGPNHGGAAGRTGPVRPSLETMGRSWPAPTVAGNYNRAGASPNAGDGLAMAACRHGPQAQETPPPGPKSSTAGPTLRRLNPHFVEWLMGFPVGWTVPEPTASGASATQSCPPRQSLHGGCCGEA